jgi:hypothetical protein
MTTTTHTTTSPLPKSVRGALKDPNWHKAMEAEFEALKSTGLGGWWIARSV